MVGIFLGPTISTLGVGIHAGSGKAAIRCGGEPWSPCR